MSKFLKNSIIYASGDIINKAVPFLMLPILTKYLTPEDYGLMASFLAFVAFLSIFIGLSVHGAVNVSFFKLSSEKLKIYIVNAILLLLVSSSIIFVIVLLFDVTISERLLLSREWVYIAVLVSFAQFLTTLNLTLWIAEENPKPYIAYQILQTILITLLSLVLIIGYEFDWRGQVLAFIIGTVSFAMLSLVMMKKRDYLKLEYNKNNMKDLLSFGIPMIPHQLGGWLSTNGDKLLLVSLLGAAATGLFTVGYQIGMMMGIVVTAFNKAWSPYLYKKLSAKPTLNEKVKIVKFTYLYFIGIIVLIIILNFIADLIFRYMLDASFAKSQDFVIYILIAYGFSGMYFMVGNYILYEKRTKLLAMITSSVAIVHIMLSYLFIQIYGAIGVAYSSVMSFGVTFILVFIFSNKVYPMPWRFWKVEKKI